MRTPIRIIVACTVLGLSAFTAHAQTITVTGPSVTVTPPTVVVPPPPQVVWQAPPPLVEVQPGVQVVPDYDEEVYYVDNVYWMRHGKHWYRSADHRGGWVVAAAPQPLVRIKVGKYRRWHPRGPRPGRGGVVVAAPGPAPGVVVVAPGHRPGVVVVGPPGRGHRGKKHRND